MSRHLLVVHGMGIYNKPNWQTEIASALNSAAEQYPRLHGTPFDRRLTIIPISYDDVFANWASEVGQTSKEVADFAEAHPSDIDESLLNLTNWLRNAGSDDFVWSHVADVIYYRFFPDARTEVHARLLKQITVAVTTAKQSAQQTGQEASISLMAHSLGTSVSHDSLERLGTEVYSANGGNDEQYLASNGTLFDNLFMVANVGGVLATKWPVQDRTCIKPRTAGNPAYCAQYFNFRHVLDPFPAVCPFLPINWGNGYLAVENLDHLRQINVHGWTHYLSHPDVHCPIFRALLADPNVVSKPEQDAARAKFLQAPSDICHGALDGFHDRLDQLVKSNTACNADVFLHSAVGYFGAVISAAAQCGIALSGLPL